MTFREIFIDNYGWIGVLVAFVLAFSSELASGLKAWRVLRWIHRPSSPIPETTTPATDAATSSLDDDWADIAQQVKEENHNA